MKKYIIPLIIGCLLIGVGSAISLVNFFEYDYINALPTNEIKQQTETVNETIDDRKFIIATYYAKVITKVDNSINPGNVKIDIEYYDRYVAIEKSLEETGIHKQLSINTNADLRNYGKTKELFRLAIKELKNKHVYNYTLFFVPTLTITTNELDINNIEIRNYN